MSTSRVSAPPLAPVLDWLAAHIDTVLSAGVRIGAIVVLALIARGIAGRLITHLMRRIAGSREWLGRGTRLAGGEEPSHTSRHRARIDTIAAVLRSTASVTVFGIAAIMVLGEFGVDLAPILAGAGVLGLAVGFGAQSLVRDVLSGVFLLSEDQYGVGDVVDVGDAVGTVEAVTLRVTKIRDLHGGLWYVRNGEIARVCNMSQDWANAVVEIPLDHEVAIVEAVAAISRGLEEFAPAEEGAARLLEPPEISGVVGIGSGAVTVRVMVKTEPGEQWAVGRELRAHLKAVLDRAGLRTAVATPAL